jgi:hypothetical protein
MGKNIWKKRITDLVVCDSMPLPDFQGPGSNQSRFASNSPRRKSGVHCTGIPIYRQNTSE